MRKIIVFIIALVVSSLTFAQVEARLDRSEITVNDSFQLIISLTETDVAPNLDALEQDFEILGHSSSTQISIVNGKQEQQTDLIFRLMPKHEGTLVVPSLKVGSSTTPALQIKVISESAESKSNTQNKPVLLTATLDQNSGIVQGQLTYTIRLYYAARLDNGQITRPNIDNALIRRIGDDRRFQSDYQGRLYQVLERQYAIFPQSSGELKIPPTVFTGMIEDMHSASHTYGPFIQGVAKPIRLATDVKTVSIKPIPAEFKDKSWLPANKVEIKENWELGQGTLHVGDPITRTIELTVYGVSSAQLPELNFPEQAGVNIYPDKAQASEQVDGNQFVSRRVWRVSYIPTKAGELNLPEVKVPWWNTEKHQAEMALVASKQISILPVKIAANAPVAPTSAKPAISPEKMGSVSAPTSRIGWVWAFAFALAWIATVILWWWTSRPKPQVQATVIPMPKPKAYVQALKLACQENQAQVAYRALLAWANAMWPESPIRNLGDIRERVEPGHFMQCLQDLQECLYSRVPREWHGEQFWLAFNTAKFIVPIVSKRPGEPLPPLYLND